MNLPPVLRQRFFDANGAPLAGGKIYTYAAGTSTLQATYTDQGGGTANANPVVLDANGEANVWLDPALSYKFILKDSSDVTQWTVDNVIGILTPNAVNTASIQDAAVTLAKLSATLGANQILGANAAGTALEAKTITAGTNITVTQGVNSVTIASPGVDGIDQHLETYDSGVKAGESILALDAVCLDLNNTTYKYFKCDSDLANRRNNFTGIAKAAATVTAHIQTYTISAAFVASNSISLTINGRAYSNTTYATSSDATLQAIATLMASDQDIASATVTAVGGSPGDQDRVIVVTGKGGLTITITSSVTGGTSQPTVTLATTQAAAGDAVSCHVYGPLGGFVGLTQGAKYYLGSTAGSITASPTDASPILVGQALTDTVLFVFFNPQLSFGNPYIFIRTKGGTSQVSTTAQTDVEHFNFTSWSTGTATASARKDGTGGDATFNGKVYWVDGLSTGGSIAAIVEHYNKTSWASDANKGTPRSGCHIGVLSSVMYIGTGNTANTAASGTGGLDSFDGTSWTNNVTTGMANSGSFGVGIVQGSKFRMCGNVSTSSTALTTQEGWNGSSTSVETAIPAGGNQALGASSTGSNAIIGGVGGSSASYQWNGSAWSSSINISYTPAVGAGSTSFDRYVSSGYSSGNTNSWINGGNNDSGSTALNTSASFNGSAWASATASTNARSGSAGGVF